MASLSIFHGNPEPELDDPSEETLQREAEEDEQAVEQFIERLQAGDGADPTFSAPDESLMRASAARASDRDEAVKVPHERLKNVQVIGTRTEERVRHDCSLTLERVTLQVEKKIAIDSAGDRRRAME